MISRRQKLIVLLISLLLIVSAPVIAGEEYLSSEHVMRVAQAQQLLLGVDIRSQSEIVDEINRTSFPEGNLQIYEAVAATYKELIQQKGITQLDKKRRLYDFIRLNVAYLQFGGNVEQGKRDLNLWIRQIFRRNLPKKLLENDQLFFSLE